jgi:hypothetical protein
MTYSKDFDKNKLTKQSSKDSEKVLKKPTIEKEDRLFYNLIWVTTKEAAQFLQRSPGQIRNMVWRGQLKAKKICGRLYFRREDLESLFDYSPFI